MKPISKHKYYSLAYRILRNYGDASTVLDMYVQAKMAYQATKPKRKWHRNKDMSHHSRQKFNHDPLALPSKLDLTTITK